MISYPQFIYDSFHIPFHKELNDLKEGLKNVNIKLKDKMESMENKQGANTANLSQKIKELEEQAKSLHDKNLYLEAYSRRENIKFMNIQETRRGRIRGNTPSLLRTRTWL